MASTNLAAGAGESSSKAGESSSKAPNRPHHAPWCRARWASSSVTIGWRAWRINADLERGGRIIGMPDVMIAAIAMHNGLPLVTGNVSHFEYVRSLGNELGVESWRDEATQAPP